MSALKISFLAIYIFTFFSLPVFAQNGPPAPTGNPRWPFPPPALKNLTESDVFYAPSELYTIALPRWQKTHRKLTAEETGGVSVGGQYKWVLSEATMTLTEFFILGDGFEGEESYTDLEKRFAEMMLEKTGSKFISSRLLTLGTYRGAEVVFTMPNGTKGISRTYASGKFQFTINAFITGTDPDAEKLAVRALDSFRILSDADRAADITRRVEAATPKDLPQSPIPARPSTDAKDEGLKGKIKSVIEESEYPENTRLPGRSKNSEDTYDEKGNLIRSTSYDYRHNPDSIKAYGYLDGVRAVKEGWVNYEYNPPAAMAAPLPPGVKPTVRDPRYSRKYVYAYDKKKLLTEELVYGNTGELNYRITYLYEGTKKERSVVNAKDEQTHKTIEIFDKKGNVVERVYSVPKYPDSTYTIKYEAFDPHGNWTKRTVTGKSGNYDGTFSDVHYIEYRTITYYP